MALVNDMSEETKENRSLSDVYEGVVDLLHQAETLLREAMREPVVANDHELIVALGCQVGSMVVMVVATEHCARVLREQGL